jgi:hypothetical protein
MPRARCRARRAEPALSLPIAKIEDGGWNRAPLPQQGLVPGELWLKSLGLDATLPPPEEQKNARSAVAAARAREQMAEQSAR